MEPCYKNHPHLPLKGGIVIYGGSCTQPVVHDADFYISFERAIRARRILHRWGEAGKPASDDLPIEVLLEVADMTAPKEPDRFTALVDWTIEQLEAGKKVHAGCIGGHGRTGTFLAALVAKMLGKKDASSYVRKYYCPHAIEVKEQVRFLSKHFGVEPVDPRH